MIEVLVANGVLAVATSEDVHVVTAAATQQIITQATRQRVVAFRLIVIANLTRGTTQLVIALTAEQDVVPVAAIKGVGPVTARQRISAVTRAERVRTAAATEQITAAASKHHVCTVTTKHLVGAVARLDDIIASPSGNRVTQIPYGYRVVAGTRVDIDRCRRPIHRVVTGAALEIAGQIGEGQRTAVGKGDGFQPSETVGRVLPSDEIVEIVEIGVAVAQTNDEVTAVDRHPKIGGGNTRAELQSIDTTILFYRRGDFTEGILKMIVIVVLY